jgi:FkbM family methyltransferase
LWEILAGYTQLRPTRNVSPYNFAVADTAGEVWITNLENDEENSISKLADEKSTLVPALDLDTFVEDNRIQSIDLLKMNIEGAEELAILGMSKSAHRIKNIAIACHDFRGDLPGTKRPVIDFLQRMGSR